jgi:hypothetical protein
VKGIKSALTNRYVTELFVGAYSEGVCLHSIPLDPGTRCNKARSQEHFTLELLKNCKIQNAKFSLRVIKNYAMKKYGGVNVYISVFLTSALDGVSG